MAEASAPTRRQEVAARIRAAIATLHLLPGDRLIERELCARFAVSRPLLREALSELATAGLVEAVPYKGLTVARIDAATARDIYTIRGELEALAGRQCAASATASERAGLRAAFRAVEHAYATGTIADWLPAKERFYDVLLAASGNATLAPMLRALHGRITLLRATTLAQPGRSKRSLRELRAIVRAIEDRDPARAAAACRDHVASAATVALAALGLAENVGGGESRPAQLAPVIAARTGNTERARARAALDLRR